jgi:hypothetical protein
MTQSSQPRLHGDKVDLDSELGHAFVEDCARSIEGLMTEFTLRLKWGLSDTAWVELSASRTLEELVRLKLEGRVRNGKAAQEAANRHFAKTPDVLGAILSNENISPRHRIDAARELRAVAAASHRDQSANNETVTININLGGDENLTYELKAPIKTVGEQG